MGLSRSFETIYQIAPESAVQRLVRFREQHPARTLEVEGLMYPMWNIGEGETAMVFIPSGMGHGEIFFPYLMDLSNQLRVMAFSLPGEKTMESYCKHIHQLLEQEGVRRIVLAGQAIGGLLVQTYVRLYPKEVAGLILCTTGAPCQELAPELAARWVERGKLALRYQIAPFDSMRQKMGYQTFASMCPEEQEESMQFWRAFISETYEHYVYKKQFIQLNCRALPDIYRRRPFRMGDMAAWPGKALILETSGDQYYGEKERGLLRQLYPMAKAVDVGPDGQLSLLTKELQCIALMRQFLKDQIKPLLSA